MKSNDGELSLENIRVIGIFAHIDAGKTTTSEAILYHTGRIHRAGSVDDGNTQLDWMEQERERGITITAAATTCWWRGCRINLIDTPGHIDFTVEVMRSIRVIDGAVIVMCGFEGVETQTETVWRYADAEQLPRLIFINKLDRESADFQAALADARRRLTPHAVAVQLPIGSGSQLRGVIDLLADQALIWQGSEEPIAGPIPAEMVDTAATARAQLLDAICELDESLLWMRLEGREPPLDDLRRVLRQAVIAGRLTPVLCGSARLRIGIRPLLDAIAAYLPSPVDISAVTGSDPDSTASLTRPAERGAPFCASTFKIVADPHVGHLAWTRVFSGEVTVGDMVYNPRTGEEERIGRIYQMHANRREPLNRMGPGDVVALVGIKSAITGDTLCSPAAPIVLEPFHFPQPVISIALSPICDEERDRLHECAARLCAEDPTLQLSYDPETGDQVLAGMGELHLEIAVDRLRSEWGVTARTSPLRIAYRETIRHKAEATGIYRKQTGGHGHFAQVRLRVEPLEAGKGILFRSIASPVDVPEAYARAAEAGAREALHKGIVAGYPMTDLQITLMAGRYHEVDSNTMDFRIAGSMAVRQAVAKAAPTLLEPIMYAGIHVEEDYLRAVLGDFARRRGTVHELQLHGTARLIRGEAPLADLRGYATDLRHMTQGRGAFTLEFRRYEVVSERLAIRIIEERALAGEVERR